MTKKRSSSRGSNTTPSSNSVLSRVLGTFRRSTPESNHNNSKNKDKHAATGRSVSADWVRSYKITHIPDEPRQGDVENLRRQSSADVLTQLCEMQNEKMQDEVVSQLQKIHQPLPIVPPKPPSSSQNEDDEDVMTIKIGMSLKKGELRPVPITNSQARTVTGHVKSSSLPHIAAGSATTATTKPSVSDSPPPFAAWEKSHKRQMSAPISRSPIKRFPIRSASHPAVLKKLPPPPPPPPPPPSVNTKPTPEAKSKTLRESVTSLYIDANDLMTPSTSSSSSRVSRSPLTPITETQTNPRTHICPLCRDPLLTTAERKQNLCAACCGEHQPRASVFSDPIEELCSDSSTIFHTSDCRYSEIEVAEARIKKLPGAIANTSGSSSDDDPADKIRLTEIGPSSLRRAKNRHVSNFSSGKGGGSRAEFKLQAVPADRKRGVRKTAQTTQPPPSTKQEQTSGSSRGSHGGQTGFQFTGVRVTSPRRITRWPTFRETESGSTEASEPTLLLPKAYCPPASPPKQNKRGPSTRRKSPSSSERGSGDPSGRVSSSPRATRIGKPRVAPIPNSIFPRSPGHSRRPQPSKSRSGSIRPGTDGSAGLSSSSSRSAASRRSKKSSRQQAVVVDVVMEEPRVDRICRQTRSAIDSIIDCYHQLDKGEEDEDEDAAAEPMKGSQADFDFEKPEIDYVGSFHMQTAYDIEIRSRGFI
ncbi:hypothetical protein GGR50DRAFT_301160 [Xylaria sp. CBS 124048]|nr:hypothetical protein GGR50DRAFT_301160 [Xylaria sp. CBS 124048]